MFSLLGKIFSRKEKPPDTQVAPLEEPKSTVLSKIVVVWDYIPVSVILPKLTLILIKRVPLTLLVQFGLNHPYMFFGGILFQRFTGLFFDPISLLIRLLFL